MYWLIKCILLLVIIIVIIAYHTFVWNENTWFWALARFARSRILYVKWMFLKQLYTANWTFCYLETIITVVWSPNTNMTFIKTIKAILTVREIVTFMPNHSFDSGQKWDLALTATCKWYLYYPKNNVHWLLVRLLLVIVVRSWEMEMILSARSLAHIIS